jgi:hypothetical protein
MKEKDSRALVTFGYGFRDANPLGRALAQNSVKIDSRHERGAPHEPVLVAEER